jgi:hypothetical protein
MLHIVTWKWGTLFGPEYVNRLHSMLRRHLHIPFIFRCFTDDPAGLDKAIITLPMYTDHAEMRAGTRSCFRRLKIFDREMSMVLGERILQLDLDTVITGDVTPLFDRSEDLVLMKQSTVIGKSDRIIYNPSMLLMNAGVLHDMWEKFHASPDAVHEAARGRSWGQSDMSIINDYLHTHRSMLIPAIWEESNLVQAYWRGQRAKDFSLKPDARIVLFYGKWNPADPETQAQSPWIAEHWT